MSSVLRLRTALALLSLIGGSCSPFAGTLLGTSAAAAPLSSAQLTPASAPLVPHSHAAPHGLAVHAAPRLLGQVASAQPLTVTVVLPLSHQADLNAFLQRVYTPGDPLYGHYLKPGEFAATYGPSAADAAAVKAFASAHGLSVSSVSHSGSVYHLSAPAGTMASAFHVSLRSYARADGTTFHRPAAAPAAASELAGHILGVFGLDSSPRMTMNFQKSPHSGFQYAPGKKPPVPTALAPNPADLPDPNNPLAGGYSLDPENIRAIYDLPPGRTSGRGQSVGLLELDGWYQSDITEYEKTFGLPRLKPVLRSVDGGTGLPTDNGITPEVTLDIDMALALAPDLDSVVVYQAPPESDFLPAEEDILDAVADDDAVSVLSVSYGNADLDAAGSLEGPGFFAGIQQALTQMAAQGQTACVAAGDAGAYSDEYLYPTPSLGTFSDQPGALAVGGTFLYTTLAETYNGESSWAAPSDTGRGPVGTGGGGGVSTLWAIPPYQIGAFDLFVNPQGSLTNRNTPDVSLFGDYDEGGYSIYLTDPITGVGNWAGYNGTSASSPLWAAFVADVNEARATSGLAPLGLVQNMLYPVAEDPAKYAVDFHDVNDGSNNLLYEAVPGYDNSTGWGSFVGANLLNDLAPSTDAPRLASLSFNPSPVLVGFPSSGTVTLKAPAPKNGVTVTITSASGAPLTTVFVPAHASSAVFSLPASATSAIGSTVYNAVDKNITKSATLIVEAKPILTSFLLSPNPIGQNAAIADVELKVGLNGPAGPAGSTVYISSGTTDLGSFTFPSGVTTDTVYLYLGYIEGLPSGVVGPTSTAYPITLTRNGASLTQTLVVENAEPSAITINNPQMTPAVVSGNGGVLTISANVTDKGANLIYVEAFVTDEFNDFYGDITLTDSGSHVYTGTLPIGANALGQAAHIYAYVEAFDADFEFTYTTTNTITQPSTSVPLNGQVSFNIGSVIRNHATGLYSQTVTTTNISGAAIAGPINLVATIPATITLVNAAGTYTKGVNDSYPYVVVPGTASGLAASGPGASATVTLQFRDPSNARINYAPLAVSGPLSP